MELAGDGVGVPGLWAGLAPTDPGAVVVDHPRELGYSRVQAGEEGGSAGPAHLQYDRGTFLVLPLDVQVQPVAAGVHEAARGGVALAVPRRLHDLVQGAGARRGSRKDGYPQDPLRP